MPDASVSKRGRETSSSASGGRSKASRSAAEFVVTGTLRRGKPCSLWPLCLEGFERFCVFRCRVGEQTSLAMTRSEVDKKIVHLTVEASVSAMASVVEQISKLDEARVEQAMTNRVVRAIKLQVADEDPEEPQDSFAVICTFARVEMDPFFEDDGDDRVPMSVYVLTKMDLAKKDGF